LNGCLAAESGDSRETPFLWQRISGPPNYGTGAAPQIFTRVRDWLYRLPSAHPNGRRGPRKKV